MDVKDFPKEWRTEKNLRWWLSQREEEFISSEDDKYVNEYLAVEFAKQFHRRELLACQKIIQRLYPEAITFPQIREMIKKEAELGE